MIKKTERSKLRKGLKHNWIADVLSKLSQVKITNKNGEAFTRGFISHVFNGRYSNDAIEKAIYEVYEERKEKQAEMIAFKRNILEKKEPEAVTSGSK